MTKYRVISETGEFNFVNNKCYRSYEIEEHFTGTEDECINYVYEHSDVMIDEDFSTLRDGGEVNGYMIEEVEEEESGNDDAEYEEAFDQQNRKGVFA